MPHLGDFRKSLRALAGAGLMNDNSAKEGGGAVFDVVDTGWGTLTFNRSHLHHSVSGEFQTFPGVYYQRDGKDMAPTMIESVDN